MEQEQYIHVFDQREIVCSETGEKRLLKCAKMKAVMYGSNVLAVVVTHGCVSQNKTVIS